LACALIAFSIVPGCSPSGGKPVDDKDVLKIVTVKEFEQKVLKAKVPVLVDFYADWCPPCKQLAPTIAALATAFKDKAVVAKVNVDKAKPLAKRYHVRSIPVLIFFVNGKPVKRMVGLQPASHIRSALHELCQKSGENAPKQKKGSKS